MDSKQFRELLEVGKELKIKKFSLDNEKLDVEFFETRDYTTRDTDPVQAPAQEMDADEQVLAHIEKLKSMAMAGTKTV